MRRRLGIWLFMGLAAIGHATGCATSGALENGVYRGEQTAYRIGPVSEDWRVVTVDRQNDVAWHSESKSAVMHVHSSCDPALDIPLAALRNHLLIGFTEREFIEEELLPMDGREAMRTHLTAKLDGVAREILLQILKKNGCVYDFGLVSPPGPSFDQALEDFDRMVAGFTTNVGPR